MSGVFTVDFFLIELENYMGKLSYQQGDFVCVFQPDGHILCGPKGPLREKFASTLSYLVSSSALQDADKYDHLVTVQHGGEKYLVALQRVETSTGLKCVVATIQSADQVYEDVYRSMKFIAIGGLLMLVLSAVLGWGIARRLATPLTLLSADLEKIRDLEFAPRPLRKPFFREVQVLLDSLERMKSGLRSFMRYVPRDVVKHLLLSGHDAALGVEPKVLTIFFSDIENFTGYTEKIPPARLVAHLSEYFEILRNAVRGASGTIDKFIGDGLLVFFNAPQDVPEHERCACEAALAAVEKLNAARGTGEHDLPFRTRIGLHSGEVLVGNIGTSERFAYTVLGDPVNTASRIENLNKVYGTDILASGSVHEKAGDGFEWRHVDRVAVVGRKGALEVYELLGVKGAVSSDILRARDLYEQALKFYFEKNLAQARDLFVGADEARPADVAAQIMIHRCEDLLKNNPGDDWDGVFIHKHK